jgi:hypothetical protein
MLNEAEDGCKRGANKDLEGDAQGLHEGSIGALPRAETESIGTSGSLVAQPRFEPITSVMKAHRRTT